MIRSTFLLLAILLAAPRYASSQCTDSSIVAQSNYYLLKGAEARELVAEFGLTVQDVFPSGRGASKSGNKASSGNKVAPKYRDPATGQSWTGRGKAPKWIDGQDRAKYLIA